MSNLFRRLFGGGRRSGKSRLTKEFLNSISGEITSAHLRIARQQAQLAAGRGFGQPITGQEILARQAAAAAAHGPGALHVQQSRAEGAFAQLLNHRPGHIGLHEANRFTRWMDIRESEDELQEFLGKCVSYGEKMQRHTNMSVGELEK
jgi:hypothetical protein